MRLFIGGILLLQASASGTKAWADKQRSWDVDWDDVWDDIANIDDEDSPTKLLPLGDNNRAKSLLRGSTNGRSTYSSTLATFVQTFHGKAPDQIKGSVTVATEKETKLRDSVLAGKDVVEKYMQQVHENSAKAIKLLASASQRRRAETNLR
jgi:hypothetical protein